MAHAPHQRLEVDTRPYAGRRLENGDIVVGVRVIRTRADYERLYRSYRKIRRLDGETSEAKAARRGRSLRERVAFLTMNRIVDAHVGYRLWRFVERAEDVFRYNPDPARGEE